jgi:hypothetical protein
MMPTPIITKILEVREAKEVPFAANKSNVLWIRCQLTIDQLALQISTSAARELMEELQRYEKVHGFQ